MDEKLPSKHVPVLKSTPHHACLLHMFNQFAEQAWLEWHKQSLVVPTWAVVWWTCYWYPAKNTSHSRHVVVMYIVPFWLAQFTWVCCQCEQTHSSSIRLERHVMSTVSWTLAICWVWFTRILGGSWKCAHIWNCRIIVHQHVVKDKTVADSNTCPEVPATASQVCGRLLMDSLCIEWSLGFGPWRNG